MGVIEAMRQGARVLSMPGVTSEMLKCGAMTADYERVEYITCRWGEHLAAGAAIRVSSAAGTDFSGDLGGWQATSSARCWRDASWLQWPWESPCRRGGDQPDEGRPPVGWSLISP